ncbi:MAG: ABC-F family ATP-binding cassette domain-containing protein [Acidobacteria bacterium]|nr:ABC-F family ATP-binding cassette domain-containing protein [Acidobacteriota bacterium]
MLVRLDNIGKSYPAADLFHQVQLQINDGDRIGLVGPNGAGKSQLLAILAGQVTPDEGRVEQRSGVTIGKMDQETRVDPSRTLLAETLEVFAPLRALEQEIGRLEETISHTDNPAAADPLLARYSRLKEEFERQDGYSYRQRAAAVLQGLGFRPDDLELPCRILSGGQISRLGLARLLLQKPALMLLDEPTNHLDLAAIEWLEEYLAGWERAFVVVSHDRYFLNRVVQRIWDIGNRRVTAWSGNYARYQTDKHKLIEQQQREYENQQQFIRQTEDYIRRNIYGQKTKQAQSRRRMLEKLERVERPDHDIRDISLDVSGIPRSSDTVLSVNTLVLGYGRPLARLPFEASFVRGDRVGILGANGTGKTTLFRTILGQIPPLDGGYQWGRNVSVGYFDQKMESLQASPLDEIRALDPLAAEGDLRSFLARFGFHGDDVFKPLATLSGGEKNRLLLARLIYLRHNVLVLDEPTNHLDIASREELESALETFPGTIFVVSHDRYFLDRLVNKILWFGAGDVDYYHGGYSDWTHRQAARAAAPGAAVAGPDAPRRKEKEAAPPRREREGLSKNERFRLEQQLTELEEAIAVAEARVSEIERLLQAPPPSLTPGELAGLAREHESLQHELEDRVARWEDLGLKLAD